MYNLLYSSRRVARDLDDVSQFLNTPLFAVRPKAQ